MISRRLFAIWAAVGVSGLAVSAKKPAAAQSIPHDFPHIAEIASRITDKKAAERILTDRPFRDDRAIAAFLQSKENEASTLIAGGHSNAPRKLYATMNSHDFRNGKTCVVNRITFSEIDVAAMLLATAPPSLAV